MRPPARGMSFLARRHVRRAHRAAFVMAAFADSDASQRRPRKAVIAAEIEMGLDLARRAGGAQMRVQTVGGDDDAWIHPAIGIENALELGEGLDQFRPEYFRKQFRACAAVAMLAGQGAAEFADQVRDTYHRGLEPPHAFGAEKVEVDPAMDAPVAEMSVEGRSFQMMRVEQRGEPAQEAAKFRRRDGSILGARPGAGTARDNRAGAETGFAQFPHRLLLALTAEQLAGRVNRLTA